MYFSVEIIISYYEGFFYCEDIKKLNKNNSQMQEKYNLHYCHFRFINLKKYMVTCFHKHVQKM